MNSIPKSPQTAFANKYRPASIKDFVMPSKHEFDSVIKFMESPVGSAWLLHGKSGLGKTSMARMMANAAAKPIEPSSIHEYTGQDLDAGFVKELKRYRNQGCCFCDRHVFIINEAHTIPAGGLDRLLDVLEDVGDSCWFFTTTSEPDAFPPAFISRVTTVEFTHQGICTPAVKWLIKIANMEGFELSMTEAEKMVREAKNNLRTAIGTLQTFCRSAQFKGRSDGTRESKMQSAFST